MSPTQGDQRPIVFHVQHRLSRIPGYEPSAAGDLSLATPTHRGNLPLLAFELGDVGADQVTRGTTDTFRLFVKGNGYIVAAAAGLESAIARAMPARPPGEVLVETEDGPGLAEWSTSLEGEHSTRVVGFDPDVVVIAPDLDLDLGGQSGSVGAAQFRKTADRVVKSLKEKTSATLIWCNVSVLQPIAEGLNPGSGEPRRLSAHRLGLELIRLSQDHGVSIVDLDRLVGELGADVTKNPEAFEGLVTEELFRIIEDYGHFDDRPITAQVGREGAA